MSGPHAPVPPDDGDCPSVEIVEVGPRDGLQDLPIVVPTDEKLELIGALVAAGLRRLEVVSFAHPARVPQMADAEAVIAGLADLVGDELDLIGLVLNERGVHRAAACGVRSVNSVVVVSDTFSMKNQGMTTADALAASQAVTGVARAESMRTGATLSAAFGCPYEGAVDPQRVVDLAVALAESGVEEVSLADTIGVARPEQTELLVATVVERIDVPVRAHFHDRGNGHGLANAAAAVRGGARYLDASVGGLGGCPFAPKGAGNVATAELVELLVGLGADPGVDVARLVDAGAIVARLRQRAPDPALVH